VDMRSEAAIGMWNEITEVADERYSVSAFGRVLVHV
jgi:hypothetical protein